MRLILVWLAFTASIAAWGVVCYIHGEDHAKSRVYCVSAGVVRMPQTFCQQDNSGHLFDCLPGPTLERCGCRRVDVDEVSR